MEKQKIRAVVFDLDGTLLDTVQDIGAGANLALHRSGFPERSIDEYITYICNGIQVLIRLACPEVCTDEAYKTVLADYLAYYPQHCTERTCFYPGIQEVVDRINEAGYTLGVITNKTEKTAKKIVSHFFPEIPFRVVWGNNGTRPLKPATDAGELLCRELALEPSQILYVGDGETDMEFASKMGFAAVGATWGYRSRSQLVESGAEVLLEKAEDLLKLLELQ